jgi:hypothetical protein
MQEQYFPKTISQGSLIRYLLFSHRLKANDENAAGKGKSAEMIITNHSYSSLEDPNINFTILPSIDKETFPAFKPFLDHVKIEEFDVFLIFITDRFDRRYSIFLKEIKLHEKPFFLIQTKMDHHADKRQKQSDDDTMFQNMKSMLGDDFTSDEIKVFLISNHYPEERDFPKLIKEVVDVLPSDQQESLCQIPSIRKLIDLHEFQTFLKGITNLAA